MNTFNVKVEYDMMPIRHIAVECPKCKKWFKGWQITENDLSEHNDIYNAASYPPSPSRDAVQTPRAAKASARVSPSSYPDAQYLPGSSAIPTSAACRSSY